MATKKLEFKNQEKTIEYNGDIYVIPFRKSSVEMKISEMSRTLATNKVIDWNTYKDCFEIFFTTEQAEKLTEKQEDCNLDELDYILQNVLELYNKEKIEKAEKQMNEQLKKIEPTLKAVDKAKALTNN